MHRSSSETNFHKPHSRLCNEPVAKYQRSSEECGVPRHSLAARVGPLISRRQRKLATGSHAADCTKHKFNLMWIKICGIRDIETQGYGTGRSGCDRAQLLRTARGSSRVAAEIVTTLDVRPNRWESSSIIVSKRCGRSAGNAGCEQFNFMETSARRRRRTAWVVAVRSVQQDYTPPGLSGRVRGSRHSLGLSYR